jgi:hypothetical protein
MHIGLLRAWFWKAMEKIMGRMARVCYLRKLIPISVSFSYSMVTGISCVTAKLGQKARLGGGSGYISTANISAESGGRNADAGTYCSAIVIGEIRQLFKHGNCEVELVFDGALNIIEVLHTGS